MESTRSEIIEKQLSASPAPAEKLRLTLELIKEYQNSDFSRCSELALDAIEMATRLNRLTDLAYANERAGNAFWKLSEYTRSMRYYETAVDRFLGLGDLYGVARCYCGIGIISGILEDYTNALEYFEEGLSASSRAGKEGYSANMIGNIGHVYLKMGRYSDAKSCFEHGLIYYEEVNEPYGAGNMLSGLAGVQVHHGEYEEGLRTILSAMDKHREANNSFGVAVTMLNTGIVYQKLGKLDQARTQLLDAMKFAQSIHLQPTMTECHKYLSDVCAEMGLAEEASEHLKLFANGLSEDKKQQVQQVTDQIRLRKTDT